MDKMIDDLHTSTPIDPDNRCGGCEPEELMREKRKETGIPIPAGLRSAIESVCRDSNTEFFYLEKSSRMAVSAIDSIYFSHLFASERMAKIFSDEGRFEGWLMMEAGLARGQARWNDSERGRKRNNGRGKDPEY